VAHFVQISRDVLKALVSTHYTQNHNFTKKIEEVKDYSYSKCRRCENRFEQSSAACSKCPHYFQHVVKHKEIYASNPYIREDKDGNTKVVNPYKPFLSITPIKLMVLLLSLCESGIVRNVTYKELANKLGCSYASIYSAIKILQKCELIKALNHDGMYDFCIVNYKDMFKPHGCGYVTVPNSVIDSLIETKTLNELRYALIALDIADAEKEKSVHVSKFTSNMPSYVRPHHIREACKQVVLFEARIYANTISLKLKEIFSGTVMRNNLIRTFVPEIEKVTERINTDITQFVKNTESFTKIKIEKYNYPELINVFKKNYEKLGEPIELTFTPDVNENLALQAMKYSIHEVEEALVKLFANYQYRSKMNTIRDYVKCINKLITSNRNEEESYSLATVNC